MQEKVGFGLIVLLAGAAGLYVLLGGVGYLVTRNDYVRLNPSIAIEGNVVNYEERQAVSGFWKYFPFVDRDGLAVITASSPDGSLEARITDNSNGEIEKGDLVEVWKEVDGVTGVVTYYHDKVVDSDRKTEFGKPSTVLQAEIIETGRQERAKWDSWLQTNYPTIKGKLHEQQQRK